MPPPHPPRLGGKEGPSQVLSGLGNAEGATSNRITAVPGLPDPWGLPPVRPQWAAVCLRAGLPCPGPHLALALCWARVISVGIRKRTSVSKATTVFFLVSWDTSWVQGLV